MYTAKITTNNSSASVSISPPPLSIMAFLGTNDPDGWVICDGLTNNARNNADGRYNNLLVNNIGKISNNIYIPPDYRGAFMRGAGSSTTKPNYAGNTVGNYQDHATQRHNHSITDPGHAHSAALGWAGSTSNRQDTFFWTRYDHRGSLNSVPGQSTEQTECISIISNSTNISIDYTTVSVDHNETRPYNLSVNWIIKL